MNYLKTEIKKMKKLILITVISLFALSCRKQAIETTKQSNFEIELLFEKDGCKVYRFYDGGNYIYYSDCRGKIYYEDYQRIGEQDYYTDVETLNN